MNRNCLRTKIIGIGAVLAIPIFLISCASMMPQRLAEPLTHSELIEAPSLSQAELFTKTERFFIEAFRGLVHSNIQAADRNSGVIRGRFVYIRQDGQELHRYNSTFLVEVRDGYSQITFSEATIQQIGFVSPQAKEMAFQGHLIGFRAVPVIIGQPLSDAEVRSQWERGVGSSTNPGPERPARTELQAERFRNPWRELIAELKSSVITN